GRRAVATRLVAFRALLFWQSMGAGGARRSRAHHWRFAQLGLAGGRWYRAGSSHAGALRHHVRIGSVRHENDERFQVSRNQLGGRPRREPAESSTTRWKESPPCVIPSERSQLLAYPLRQ